MKGTRDSWANQPKLASPKKEISSLPGCPRRRAFSVAMAGSITCARSHINEAAGGTHKVITMRKMFCQQSRRLHGGEELALQQESLSKIHRGG